MRMYRIIFVGGLAIGYVLGARAGRERYDQLKQLAKKVAESPAMQQTAGAVQAQAAATAKSARELAAKGVRSGVSKVTGKRPDADGADSSASANSGSANSGSASSGSANSGSANSGSANSGSANSASDNSASGNGARPFVPASGEFGQHGVL
jgi:hypothetical protein